jgi:hypothetical protein
MKKGYVAYQNGYVVFGFGETRKSALDNAHEWTDFDDSDVKESYEANHGDMTIEEISAEHLNTLMKSKDPANCFCWED